MSICLDFRGYTVRRRWGAEVEARVKRVLASYNNPREAHAALQVIILSPSIFLKL